MECGIGTADGTCDDGYIPSEHPNVKLVSVTTIMSYDNGSSSPYTHKTTACDACIRLLRSYGDTVSIGW